MSDSLSSKEMVAWLRKTADNRAAEFVNVTANREKLRECADAMERMSRELHNATETLRLANAQRDEYRDELHALRSHYDIYVGRQPVETTGEQK